MIRTSVATTRIETLRNKIMSWTKSLLNNKNENAIWNATYSMFVITLTMSGFDQEENQNSMKEQMDKDGTIAKLVEIFKNGQYLDKQINQQVAITIGLLFKGLPIPSDFGPALIDTLKQLSLSQQSHFSNNSIDALKQRLILLCCQATSIMLQDNEPAMSLTISEGNLLRELISVFQKLPVDEVTSGHLAALFDVFNFTTIRKIETIPEDEILELMMKMLESNDEDIIWKSTKIILSFTISNGLKVEELIINPLLQKFEKDGTIYHLLEIFQNDFYQNKEIYGNIAVIIGCLFKATKIPDDDISQIA
ncbi:MAG: hypothetical protein EZS28_019707 [Streblomastix strix]|uniref:Uncharacterized protein n=1 Tax=Streblomastix strix TaxID=222440 RepID=A0A5J4VQ29_9EUKA|nr:MAG: hypothetical protein EZS28_019707 [Streblomastix strix]